MAWIDIKKKNENKIYRVTEEAFTQTFKEQGFEVVNKPKNAGSVTQDIFSDKTVNSTKEVPSKRQYKRN